MQNKHFNDVARLLKTMSHPTRLKILCLLQDKEMTVKDIHKEVNASDVNVSQHLSVLRDQGIIVYHKDAKYIYNRITERRVIDMIKTMREIFCRTD